jgi:hypothetical protein
MDMIIICSAARCARLSDWCVFILQVHCHAACNGEGARTGEDVHLVPEGTTSMHQVQGRDERQNQDSGQCHTTASLPDALTSSNYAPLLS